VLRFLLIKLQPALLQLFLADTNRVTSETPMNLASSRSHCLFTITIEARQVGAAELRVCNRSSEHFIATWQHSMFACHIWKVHVHI
jgi:Kinesin motor domain